MTTRTMAAILGILALLASPAGAFAPEARGAGMGGAYSALGVGAEALLFNPATLNNVTMASGLVGGSVEASNNILTANEVQLLWSADQADKDKVVKLIRDSGKDLGVKVDGSAGAAVSIMGFGLGIHPRIAVNAKDVTADAMESWMNNGSIKLQADGTYDINGFVEGAQYNEFSLGYGHEMFSIPGVAISGGLALKLFKGLDYTLVDTKQHLDPDVTKNAGEATYVKSSSGQGAGLDLGLHAGFLGNMASASLALKNVGAKIDWDAKVQEGVYSLNPADLKIAASEKDGTWEQKLPTIVLLGVGGSIPVMGTSAGLEIESNSTDKESRIRLGIEQNLLMILNLRAGVVSGVRGAKPMATLGLGLGALLARLDAAVGFASDQKSGMGSVSGSLAF